MPQARFLWRWSYLSERKLSGLSHFYIIRNIFVDMDAINQGRAQCILELPRVHRRELTIVSPCTDMELSAWAQGCKASLSHFTLLHFKPGVSARARSNFTPHPAAHVITKSVAEHIAEQADLATGMRPRVLAADMRLVVQNKFDRSHCTSHPQHHWPQNRNPHHRRFQSLRS